MMGAAGQSAAGQLQLALRHQQAGRLGEAERIYRQILLENPRNADALHLLGIVAAQVGRFDVAIDLVRQAIAINPTNAEFHYNLGNAQRDLGRPDEAILAYRQAIRLKPGYAEAQNNLGNVLRDRGEIDEAMAAFREAVRINPNHLDARLNLGVALRNKGRLDEAMAAYRHILRAKPDYFKAHYNLGIALRDAGSYDEAIASYREALRVKPDYAEAHNNLGNALDDQGFYDEAIAEIREALRLKGDYHEARVNLGVALANRGLLDEAIETTGIAIELKPDYAEAHVNLAGAHLLNEELGKGWREYEWRLRSTENPVQRRNFVEPRWDGEDLGGRTILLHAEQGFGDTIQFVRYVAMVAARGGKVVLECQRPLLRLLSGLPGAERVIAAGEALPAFDVQCPLLSLPMIFGTELGTIPAMNRYLRASEKLVEAWAERLKEASGMKVGILWAGNVNHKNDRNRSLPAEQLRPLGNVSGVNFYSLQKLDDARTGLIEGMRLIDYTGDLGDFADTAGLIENLDLVIAPDTAVAHLAAAMGKPTWVMLPYAPDWRWLLNRVDSPWYPAVRLFRQKTPRNWADVIQDVAQALIKHIQK